MGFKFGPDIWALILSWAEEIRGPMDDAYYLFIYLFIYYYFGYLARSEAPTNVVVFRKFEGIES